MRILFINSVCGIGSTGRICLELAQKYEAQGHTVRIAYGRSDEISDDAKRYGVKIGNRADLYSHVLKTRLLDQHGFGSAYATRRFLEWADKYNPDLLWLHNLHGYYINIQLLFGWIKKRQRMQRKQGLPVMEVRMTLHDCWTFTGHCAHFDMAGCNQWETGCMRCPEKRAYPASILLDRCRKNYQEKKTLFQGVKNVTLITPSKWLERLVKRSYLKDYDTKVIYNTIDTEAFQPTPSDFRRKNHIRKSDVMLLGVANQWNETKGYDIFLDLRKKLSLDYKIVLVGVTAKQRKALPKGIIGIEHTDSKKELAEIYTAADYFVNPTRQDNYPTVNLEAQACGTKVITFPTGGSPESAMPNGIVTRTKDAEGIVEALREKQYE